MLSVWVLVLFTQLPAIRDVPDRAVCENCIIQLQNAVTIGATTSAALMPLSTIARNSRGEFLLGPIAEPGSLAVFDSLGQFLKTWGRRGPGPGELNDLFRVYSGPTGLTYVHDARSQRVNVYDAGGNFRTQLNLGAVTTLLPLGNGRILVNGAGPTPQNTRFSLHLVDSAGNTLRSFGEREDDQAELNRRVLAVSKDGTFWIGRPNSYTIERWDERGRLQTVLRRTAEWFPPWKTRNVGQPYSTPPRPSIKSMHEDREGRLWIVLNVPDSEWKAVTSPARFADQSATTHNKLLDTIVEVLDPKSGEVLARRRFDVALNWVSDDYVAARSVDNNGEPTIDVFRIFMTRIVKRPPRKE